MIAPRPLALAPVLAVLATGCGGGGGSSAGDYVKKADAICADVRSQIEALGNPKSFPALAKDSDRAAAIARDGVTRLRALGAAPKDIRAPADKVIAELSRRRSLVEQLARAARNRDGKAIQRLAGSGRATSAQTAAAARKAGFKSCGLGGTGA